jgi:hypothetical protein
MSRVKELADMKQLGILALEQQVLVTEKEASKKLARIMQLEKLVHVPLCGARIFYQIIQFVQNQDLPHLSRKIAAFLHLCQMRSGLPIPKF